MSNNSNRIKSVIITDIIVLFVCLFGLFQNYNKGGLGADRHIIFEWINDNVVVSEVKDAQLRKSFQKGDIVQKVEDYAIFSKNDIEFILDGFSIGDDIRFQVLRAGQFYDLTIRLPAYYAFLNILLQGAVAIIFLILGIFTFYSRPDYDAAVIWHWASVGTAIMISCTWGHYSYEPYGLGYSFRIIFYGAYSFVPAAFLHLSLIFPKHKTIHLNKILYPLYIFAGCLFLAQTITWLTAVIPMSLEDYSLFMSVFNFNRLFFALCIFVGIGAYLHSYQSVQEQYQKRQVRWMLLGLAIGPPFFILFWQIPLIFSLNAIIREEFIVVIMLVIPITFYIAIIKHHIFNIDLILSRSTVYIIVVALLFIIYGSLVGITFLFIGELDIESSLISSIAAAILTPILFEPARRYFRKIVDKVFFRVTYNYRLAQSRLTAELDKIVDKKAVANLVLTQIDDLLQLKYFAFYLHDKSTNKWDVIASKHFSEIRKDLIDDVFKIITKTNKLILTASYNIESGLEHENLDKYESRDMQNCLVVPFKNHEFKTLGVIILGLKKSGKKFNLEDIDLLKTLSIQVGLAIDKINLQQQLIFKNIEAEQLKELNQLKSYFVSSVSHELQTPLTSIKMFAELLRDKNNIPEKNRLEYLAIIQGESDRLSRLINMVLDFSKIERGEKRYHLEKLNLSTVVADVMQSMKYQFDQYAFKVGYELIEKSIFINGDRDALFSACTNILSNAIKYSDKIKEVNVSLEQTGDNAVIKFSDKGVGIKDSEKEKIFNTFYRSSDEKIQSMGGAGLGLTVVKHIIAAHGGQIDVESAAGKGSVFSLSLPLVPKTSKEVL